MVPAVTADDLKNVGVAAFRLAVNDAGRLTAEHHRPAKPRFVTGLHAAP